MLRFCVFFFCWFSLFTQVAFAFDNAQMRDTFLKAERQLWKTDSSTYLNLYKQLHYYPLQPYLDQRRLMIKMRLTSAKEIEQFLTKYEGSPLDWPLRKKWLEYLIKRNRQTLFMAFFKPTSDVNLTCHYYQYKLNSGAEEQQILKNIDRLWVVGKSQPKSCDPLFAKWQKAGLRTQSHVWQRLVKAADGGKHTLIPYLTSLMPKKQQYLGKLWHKVRRNPAYITKLSRFPTKSKKETEIFIYGIKRLIWRSPDNAIATFNKAAKVFPITDDQLQQVALKFSLALASKKHRAAKTWLAKVADQHLTSNIVQWKIADVLRQQDWHAIKQVLSALPKNQQSTYQWRYWYGRSLIETGDETAGKAQLKSLADQRHYYGFLAASYLQQPMNLQHNPLVFSELEKQSLFENSAGKRAFELFRLGRFYHARKEWNYWVSTLDKRQRLGAAKLANEIGWYDRAIFALSRVGYLDDVDLRFPLAFNEQITTYSDQHKIPSAWAFAIARRESSFMSDANSAVGAKGLMQVMPGTAKQLTRKKKISNSYLFDSGNNIRLGTKYLKNLLDRYDGNQILATASYNAGPYRVKKWLAAIDSMPADIWIETIPFKETREYVKSVLAYQQIYQQKVGQPTPLFEQLHRMNITR
ncbi:transglycosylase SLT domain-containing protein [Thalassotalea hakodatensis]|uniref:transglycosylase SLT domain-containing protein n=1 Tax=Thalassotalea hakodatensis TaxID=3030492 RepID=UPI0025724194|nr:transglycosylase SLT domain-containing protein [Thalassotalea hakodatensis]